MVNCKTCGFPLPIAEDGEILACVYCQIACRIKKLEDIVFTHDNIQTAKVMAQESTLMGIEVRAGWEICEAQREVHHAKFDARHEKLIKCLGDLEAKFNLEIIKIKKYCQWLKNR